MSNVKKVSSDEFNNAISNGVVLVDFYADWCMPCKMLAPIVDNVAEEFNGKVSVCKINIDEAPEVASKYGIMSIPTVIAFKNGEVSEKSVGLVDKDTLSNLLNKVLE